MPNGGWGGGHPARKRKKGRKDGPNIVISSSYW
jgi:hypothetical protein